MPLARFTPTPPLQVTIRTNGRFAFNTAATAYLHARAIQRVTLYGDRDDMTVQLAPAAATDRAAALVSYSFREDGTPASATIEVAPFLRWLGYHIEHSLRFTLRVVPCTIVPPQHHTGHAEQFLAFTATPEQAIPVRIGRPPGN